MFCRRCSTSTYRNQHLCAFSDFALQRTLPIPVHHCYFLQLQGARPPPESSPIRNYKLCRLAAMLPEWQGIRHMIMQGNSCICKQAFHPVEYSAWWNSVQVENPSLFPTPTLTPFTHMHTHMYTHTLPIHTRTHACKHTFTQWNWPGQVKGFKKKKSVWLYTHLCGQNFGSCLYTSSAPVVWTFPF